MFIIFGCWFQYNFETTKKNYLISLIDVYEMLEETKN